jgi:hypothetical protein
MGLKTNDRERKKKVKSRGLVTDTFIWGEKRSSLDSRFPGFARSSF